MLSSVYYDAIRHRAKTLSILHDGSYEKIIQMAKENWTVYTPTKMDCDIIGIDSSYNSIKYQGIELWVATAVAARADNSIECDLHQSGLGGIKGGLPEMASLMEMNACLQSINKSDLILMDGSVHTKILDNTGMKNNPTLLKNKNIIFVSKTSDTQQEFNKFNSKAGDIFYYARSSQAAGFSRPFVDTRYGAGYTITSWFLRLAQSQPLLKIEILSNRYTIEQIKKLANYMSKNSIMGYPHSLRLAHQNCKISTPDMQRFARLHGLLNETGSREVLD